MTRHFGGIGPVRNNDSARYIVIISLFLLVICGFVAVVFLSSGSSSAKEPTTVVIHEPQIEMVEVLVPIQKIEQGTQLEPSMFRKENRPKVGLSPGAIKDFEQIQGTFAASLVVADQPLHQEYVTKVRPVNPITKKLPEGYRAVTIKVDEKTAVEGWVAPGAHVDVVWVSELNGRKAIQVIVENAEVLSANKLTEQSQHQQNANPAAAQAPNTITLQVSTEDSKKIQLASMHGTLSLSLRGDRDSGKTAASRPLTLDDLYGGTKPQEAPKQECLGKVKTCTKDGLCEELCLGRDGKLTPQNPS
jgi:pilus assembly protein CpaB